MFKYFLCHFHYCLYSLGDGGVGKSAVTLQFVSHSFLDYHDPTIGKSIHFILICLEVIHFLSIICRGFISAAGRYRW